MKATGIVRSLDNLGRLVIPIELRKTLNINEKDSLEIFTEGQDIIIRKYTRGCYSCKEIAKSYKKIFDRDICPKCYSALKKQIQGGNYFDSRR